MVTLVDSSVWIDFLRDRDTPQTDRLIRLLRSTKILTADLVLTEVLQGVRDERAHDRALELLSLPGILSVSSAEVAIQAARNYRHLRGRGITIRKTIDTLIATRCILDGIPLLYADRDYDPFVQHLGLRSAMDLPTGAE
ncbi:twitching motility protein PilT [Sphingomonas sp. Leaf412]|uniref:type II toxin-antitoxin system VapC family toxin n=1 Tax=Sphingomonas sp. Leaf412 TaxID=1736370 RepID=UPI0006FFC8EB|nr:PIN domain nuclease [Sphingomonas sp. Leaf412]KQT32058.1 twitching motility protein PilT [Sphingomonas sp. Leaf412]